MDQYTTISVKKNVANIVNQWAKDLGLTKSDMIRYALIKLNKDDAKKNDDFLEEIEELNKKLKPLLKKNPFKKINFADLDYGDAIWEEK